MFFLQSRDVSFGVAEDSGMGSSSSRKFGFVHVEWTCNFFLSVCVSVTVALTRSACCFHRANASWQRKEEQEKFYASINSFISLAKSMEATSH